MTAPTPWAVTSQAVPTLPACSVRIDIAGTSVMNGLAMSATAATPKIGLRQPFTAHATRGPLDLVNRIGPWSRPSRGAELCTNENITTTTTNDAALSAKHMPIEPKASATPASSGPMTRPRLNWADESDTAAKTSSRSDQFGQQRLPRRPGRRTAEPFDARHVAGTVEA